MRRASSSTCSELPFHPETPALRAEFNLLRLETGAENMMATAQLRPQMMRLTDAAANRIKSVITNSGRPIVGVRVGVKNGGCAGMAYTMGICREGRAVRPLRTRIEFSTHPCASISIPQLYRYWQAAACPRAAYETGTCRSFPPAALVPSAGTLVI